MCLSDFERSLDWTPLLPGLAQILGGADRYSRALAAAIVSRLDEKYIAPVSLVSAKNGVRAVVSYAFGWVTRTTDIAARMKSFVPSLVVAILKNKTHSADLKLDAVRLLQITLGDVGPNENHPPVFDGYASRIDLDPFERD